MEHHTLILTPWMAPHRIVNWKESCFLLMTGKINVLEEYEAPEDAIRTPTMEFQLPSVATLKKAVASVKRGVKFSRVNVFSRDDYTCQYCGKRGAARDLNYDHVIPRVQGGKTDWHNICTSCVTCNDKKGGRTPEQAGMKLRKVPVKPKVLPMASPMWPLDRVPEAWKPYIDPTSIHWVMEAIA